ncbi:MAG: EAL domain-containing protein [Acidimicrobiales bacterium]
MTDRSLASIGEALASAFAPSSLPGPDPTAPFPSLAGTGQPDRRAAAATPSIAVAAVPADDPERLDLVASARSAYDGVVVTLPDPATGWHHIMYVSANLAATLGYDAEHLLGRAFVVLFGDDPPRDQLALIDQRLAEGCQVEASHVLRHRTGSAVAVHATHTPLPAVHPGSRYRLILFRDLTRRATDEMLAEQEQALASLARGQDLGSLCHDVACQVEAELHGLARCWIGVSDGNDSLEPVITAGHDPEVVGHVVRLVMGSGDPTSARCVLVEHLPPELAEPLRATDVLSLWAFPALDRNNQQRGALVVAHTADEMPTQDEVRLLDQLATTIAEGIERAAIEAGLAQRALHDPLTRLPNRVLIVDRLEQAMARLDRESSSLAVLLVDIDRFRSVNDTWGPEVGDRVLTEVAGRLLVVVRLGDTVGRISSDQFLMICMAANDFDPSVVARRVIRSLQEPIRLPDGNELRITASVGVVVVEQGGVSPTAIISNAESALAAATEGGRGRYALYDPGRQRVAKGRHAFEQALAAAITGGELEVHYQPVCEISTGRMIGAEALVRWNRPGHGLVSPGEFIGVAEETGLIVPIGAWLIDEVARHVAAWSRMAERAAGRVVPASGAEAGDDGAPVVDLSGGTADPVLDLVTSATAAVHELTVADRGRRPADDRDEPDDDADADAELAVVLGVRFGKGPVGRNGGGDHQPEEPSLDDVPVISINLSARQLAEEETLVPHVIDALRRHDLAPESLGFEVTESMRIDDPEVAAATLRALSGLGCRIAVDDFGIGYATLDYLRHFSMADIIKIDRSFVAGLGRSKEDTAIVHASLALAESLKMQVVAEGVETVDQLVQLDEMGCHYAQGYVLSPPVDLDTAVALWVKRYLANPDVTADADGA